MSLTYYQQEIKKRGFKLSLQAVETRSGEYFRATITRAKSPTSMGYPMIKFGKLFRSKSEAAWQAYDVLAEWGAEI